MKEEQFANQELRANKASKVTIIEQQIDPKYKVIPKSISGEAVASKTGHLELFTVEPLQPSFPSFSASWDLQANTVDIDLVGDTAAQRAFAAEGGGYRGHHTKVISNLPRIYLIEIHTPAEHVFTGTITLNMDLHLQLMDSLSFQDSIRVELIPAAVEIT